jgi:hypothetical protein
MPCLDPALSKFHLSLCKIRPQCSTGACPASRVNTWYILQPSIVSLDLSYNVYFQVMQSQMIGMQSSLDRILSAVQSPAFGNQHQGYSGSMGPGRDSPGFMSRNGYDTHGHVGAQSSQPRSQSRSFPPLPGFAPPVRSFTISIGIRI